MKPKSNGFGLPIASSDRSAFIFRSKKAAIECMIMASKLSIPKILEILSNFSVLTLLLVFFARIDAHFGSVPHRRVGKQWSTAAKFMRAINLTEPTSRISHYRKKPREHYGKENSHQLSASRNSDNRLHSCCYAGDDVGVERRYSADHGRDVNHKLSSHSAKWSHFKHYRYQTSKKAKHNQVQTKYEVIDAQSYFRPKPNRFVLPEQRSAPAKLVAVGKSKVAYAESRSDNSSNRESPSTTSYHIPFLPQLESNFVSEDLRAQPIMPVKLPPQNLNEIFFYQPWSPQLTDVILYLKFARGLAAWDPRSQSDWKWMYSDTNYPADHAVILGPSSKSASLAVTDTLPGVTLLSWPFVRFKPNEDEMANMMSLEAAIEWKKNVPISSEGKSRILFRMKYSCQAIAVEQHPFPSSEVSKPWDDPRLASCAFMVFDPHDGPSYSFAATSNGVWAVYRSGRNGQQFSAKRRVATLSPTNNAVDVGVEFDGMRNTVNFYFNGNKVWTIYALGAPPPLDGLTKIDYGRQQGPLRFARPTSLSMAFGTQKCLDESDPNNHGSLTRLVQVKRPDSPTYSTNAQFYDRISRRSNNLWGQGAEMTVYKLLVVRTKANGDGNIRLHARHSFLYPPLPPPARSLRASELYDEDSQSREFDEV